MSAVRAEKITHPEPPKAAEIVPFPAGESTADTAPTLLEEARLGAERLARMPHDELRQEIARRVDMLENVLKDREERRAAIEEALLAQRVLESRRARALRIRRKVNIGSSLAAAMFTGLVIVGTF